MTARGSSPRMRGALGFGVAPQLDLGIIPADAGSTWRGWVCDVSAGDHPRGCGEHSLCLA